MSAALYFGSDASEPEFEITVEEPAPDLVREVEKVARTFESSPSQEELDSWMVKAELDLLLDDNRGLAFGVMVDADTLFRIEA